MLVFTTKDYTMEYKLSETVKVINVQDGSTAFVPTIEYENESDEWLIINGCGVKSSRSMYFKEFKVMRG